MGQGKEAPLSYYRCKPTAALALLAEAQVESGSLCLIMGEKMFLSRWSIRINDDVNPLSGDVSCLLCVG